jgi:hypothetical protein
MPNMPIVLRNSEIVNLNQNYLIWSDHICLTSLDHDLDSSTISCSRLQELHTKSTQQGTTSCSGHGAPISPPYTVGSAAGRSMSTRDGTERNTRPDGKERREAKKSRTKSRENGNGRRMGGGNINQHSTCGCSQKQKRRLRSKGNH